MAPNPPSTQTDLFNPTDEHRMLREMIRDFAETEVEPQAAEYDEKQCMNVELLRKLGDLGCLGITVGEEDLSLIHI